MRSENHMGFLRYSKITAVILAGILIVYSLNVEYAFARAHHAAETRQLKATQPQLQALFIKKITKYVFGPDKVRLSDGQPVRVAAVSPRELSRFFNRPDDFRLIRWPGECQVLFLNGKNPRSTAAILQKVRELPVLTIGSSPDFMRQGGIINLVESGSRFKLQVNVCAARRAGLTISSKLLKLSEIYCGDSLQ